MKKSRSRIIHTNIIKARSRKDSVEYLLEAGTLEDMQAAKQITDSLANYNWDYYAEVAGQRNAIQEQIKESLIQKSTSYKFTNWQRAVKYKYGLHPLSTNGSLNFVGGRFNTGTGVNTEVPTFPCLYLAHDKDTALQEHLGQVPVPLQKSEFTAREIALTNPSSETIVSVSGKLDKVFDLTKATNLRLF